MAGEKPDVLLVGAKKPVLMKGLEGKVTLHHWLDAKDKEAFVKAVGDKIRAIAIAYTANKVDEKFLKQFPHLERSRPAPNWKSRRACGCCAATSPGSKRAFRNSVHAARRCPTRRPEDDSWKD